MVRGDLLDEQAMRQGMQGCEVVFHVAGYLSGWGTYEAFYEANVVGTERALSAAKAASVSRFVQVGASAVVMDEQFSRVRCNAPNDLDEWCVMRSLLGFEVNEVDRITANLSETQDY